MLDYCIASAGLYRPLPYALGPGNHYAVPEVAVRYFMIHNALYCFKSTAYGLRLDAVHAIRDDSKPISWRRLPQRSR